MRFTSTLFFVLISVLKANAQCVSDSINEAVWQNPSDYLKGFTIDNDIADNDTAVFLQGQNTSITFQLVWPKKIHITTPITGDLIVTDIKNFDIPNLPLGLDWSLDSVADFNNNEFYPQDYRYGTLTLCGAMLSTYGFVELDLSSTYCATLSSLIDCQTVISSIYINVLPVQEIFSVSPTYGCGADSFNFSVQNQVYPANDYIWTLDGSTYTGHSLTKYITQNTAVSLSLYGDTWWDTVRVFNEPFTPAVDSQNVVLCIGDTTFLMANAPNNDIQWYKNGNLLYNQTNDSLKVFWPGHYYAEIKEFGNPCVSHSIVYSVSIESIEKPAIFENNSNQLEVLNPNNYKVQWFADSFTNPNDTNNIININQLTEFYSCTFTSINGCSNSSEPYKVCFPGSANSNISTLSLNENIIFTAQNFKHTDKTEIAWAISSIEDGPITTQTQIQQAANQGLVFESTSPNVLELSCADFDFEEGQYYATPFLNKARQDSLYYNENLTSCKPEFSFDMYFSQGNWMLCQTILTYPNNIYSLDLLNLGPNSPCVNSNLINGVLGGFIPDISPLLMYPSLINPNGTYSLTLQNAGTDDLTITIPAFTVTLYADSCSPYITQDQIIYIDTQSVTVAANTTNTLSFSVPPVYKLPEFVSNCNEIGTSFLFNKQCNLAIQDLDLNKQIEVFPNPNKGSFEIKFKDKPNQALEFKVLNILGETVYTQNQKTNLINLPKDLSNGIYIFQTNFEGNSIQKKFVLQR